MPEDPHQPSESGWSFGKIVLVVLGLIGMVGFGVCTLCGTVIAVDMGDGGIWVMVLGGAVMTALSTWLVMTLFRKAREARQNNQPRP
jgi:Na+-driven multidrug efflux pump